MRHTLFRSALVLGLVSGLVLAMGGASAGAKPGKARAKKVAKPAVATMTLLLDDQEILLGETVTGTVTLRARSGRKWVAVPAATIRILVDGVTAGTVVTDSAGAAAVSYQPATIGAFTMKVIYAGSSSVKRAQRARGFEVADTFYADADGDGYGDAASPVEAVEQPLDAVPDDTDCDDGDAGVHPGAVEIEGNEVDDDCDGVAA